jgi:hypothetical protein
MVGTRLASERDYWLPMLFVSVEKYNARSAAASEDL